MKLTLVVPHYTRPTVFIRVLGISCFDADFIIILNFDYNLIELLIR